MRPKRRNSPLQGALAGVFAGLAASYVMTQFQAGLSSLKAAPAGGGDPTTVKAAQKLAGHPIPKAEKTRAGEAVHYAFGALIGAFYGIGVSVDSRLAAGAGLPYGLAVMLVADEALVPAFRLAKPPGETPPGVHGYSAASHMVFGLALEAARRVFTWAL